MIVFASLFYFSVLFVTLSVSKLCPNLVLNSGNKVVTASSWMVGTIRAKRNTRKIGTTFTRGSRAENFTLGYLFRRLIEKKD